MIHDRIIREARLCARHGATSNGGVVGGSARGARYCVLRGKGHGRSRGYRLVLHFVVVLHVVREHYSTVDGTG